MAINNLLKKIQNYKYPSDFLQNKSQPKAVLKYLPGSPRTSSPNTEDSERN